MCRHCGFHAGGVQWKKKQTTTAKKPCISLKWREIVLESCQSGVLDLHGPFCFCPGEGNTAPSHQPARCSMAWGSLGCPRPTWSTPGQRHDSQLQVHKWGLMVPSPTQLHMLCGDWGHAAHRHLLLCVGTALTWGLALWDWGCSRSLLGKALRLEMRGYSHVYTPV